MMICSVEGSPVRVISGASRDRWAGVDVDDPVLASPTFLAVAVDELSESTQKLLGLPALRLIDANESTSIRVLFDPQQFEVIVPVADARGTTLTYAAATPTRLIVYLDGAPLDLDALRERMAWDAEHPAAVALFLFVEMALRSFRTAIHSIRGELDVIEEALIEEPSSGQLVQLNGLHRRISAMRHDLGEYADALNDANDQLRIDVSVAPAAARLARAHETSVGGVLSALSLVRDEVANTMELHRSLMSARQGEVINRLTVISALLLPLSFVTGFFGMNFGWLTDKIGSAESFWLLGVAIPAATATILIGMMWRAGWLIVLRPNRPDTTPYSPPHSPPSPNERSDPR